MTLEKYPEVYLYRRIVQAKIYIDSNYTDNIDLENIADEAYFSKFHFILDNPCYPHYLENTYMKQKIINKCFFVSCCKPSLSAM